jgi:hypothetical protein
LRIDLGKIARWDPGAESFFQAADLAESRGGCLGCGRLVTGYGRNAEPACPSAFWPRRTVWLPSDPEVEIDSNRRSRVIEGRAACFTVGSIVCEGKSDGFSLVGRGFW